MERSLNLVKRKFASILVDAIILDDAFRIWVVSENVQASLDFQQDELANRHINYLSRNNEDLEILIRSELNDNFFQDKLITLSSKVNGAVSFAASGFSIRCGRMPFIVLQLKPVGNTSSGDDIQDHTRAELDQLIYRIAHDLRGPLATLRGLANLLMMRKSNDDVNYITGLIKDYADKLDSRLMTLLYVADADVESIPKGQLNFYELEASLLRTMLQNHKDALIGFSFSCPPMVIKGINEQHVFSLMNNLFLFLLSIKSDNPSITMKFSAGDEFLECHIQMQGFSPQPSIRDSISQPSFIYSDMLQHPHLIHYYAAHKVSIKLGAHLSTTFKEDDLAEVSVFIPLNTANTIIHRSTARPSAHEMPPGTH
jgi:hypothetical protein